MLSPEMIAVIITAGTGLVGGVTAWNNLSNASALSKTENEARKAEIVALRMEMKELIEKKWTELDKKINDHIHDNQEFEKSLKAQLLRLWDWQALHEKEAANMRLELQKQIGKLEAGLTVHDGHYGNILNLISELKSDFGTRMGSLETQLQQIKRI